MIQLQSIHYPNEHTATYRFTTKGNIGSYFKKRHFSITYDVPVTDIPESILTIPFIGAVFPVALLTNDMIRVPKMDRQFYHCIPELIKGYRSIFSPPLHLDFTLQADRLEDNSTPVEPAYQAAVLFSGGVDSTASYALHRHEKPLLITVHGSDISLHERQQWRAFCAYRDDFAAFHRTEHATIRTDARKITANRLLTAELPQGLNWFSNFQHGSFIITSCAPLLYFYNIPLLYTPASCAPYFPYPISMDPQIDNHYRFGNSRPFHDAYELDRREKVDVIDKMYRKIGQRFPLRVCFQRRGNLLNCNQCEKCMRTMFCMRLADIDPNRYGLVYDPVTVAAAIRQLFVNSPPNGNAAVNIVPLVQHMSTSPDHLHDVEFELYEWLRQQPPVPYTPSQQLNRADYSAWQKKKLHLYAAFNRLFA